MVINTDPECYWAMEPDMVPRRILGPVVIMSPGASTDYTDQDGPRMCQVP